MSNQQAKMAAGCAAADLIENGMIVGLGTGSTAACFIDALIVRCRKGLYIQAVASSRASAKQAADGGIKVLDINDMPRIDITVDGTDEIDPQKRMIKGGGGAHVREKILASSSREMIVVIDETKLVPSVGRGKLPVEILFYGSPATRTKLERAGYKGQWRLNADGSLFITENSNLIFDIHFDSPPHFPEKEDQKILSFPGVVDTGFFFNLAGRVILGKQNGTAEIYRSLA